MFWNKTFYNGVFVLTLGFLHFDDVMADPLTANRWTHRVV